MYVYCQQDFCWRTCEIKTYYALQPLKMSIFIQMYMENKKSESCLFLLDAVQCLKQGHKCGGAGPAICGFTSTYSICAFVPINSNIGSSICDHGAMYSIHIDDPLHTHTTTIIFMKQIVNISYVRSSIFHGIPPSMKVTDMI